MRCSTRASGTGDGMTAIAPSAPSTAARPRGVVLDFAAQQPLGTVSFVIILLMTIAGIFSEWVVALRSAAHRFRRHPAAAKLGALGRHRRLRPRHLLPHHLRRAHRAGDQPDLVVRRLDHRRHPRHRLGLFRRLDRRLDPALHGHPAGVPDHRAGAGRGRGAEDRGAVRDRHQPDRRHRHPDRAAGVPRGARGGAHASA